MKLQAHQREALIKALSGAYGIAELTCDGHRVQAAVVRVSERSMTYEIAVFVDGCFKVVYLSKGNLIGEKFYPVRKRRIYSAAKRAKLEKIAGKRAARRYFNLDAVQEYRWPFFRTARAFVAHIEANNEQIELMSPRSERCD